MKSLVFEVLETLLLGVAVFLVLQAAVQNFRVEGGSMDPTLANGRHLLVNKLAYAAVPFASARADATADAPGAAPAPRYLFGPPQRGDVVVFRNPDNDADLVKRVVALPGESVEMRDGRVFVDGAQLPEPYISSFDGYDLAPQTVPDGAYFVLGDNRSASYDSRLLGPIDAHAIIGKAWFVYWPLSEIAPLN